MCDAQSVDAAGEASRRSDVMEPMIEHRGTTMGTSKVRASRPRPIAILAIAAVVTAWTVASAASADGRVGASSDHASARCSATDSSTSPIARDDPGRWSWLAGTTWYVPRSGLPASRYDPKTGASTPVRDQTVYTIANYTDGYFSGSTVIQTTEQGAAPEVLLRNLVASVTPRGTIMLTFVPPDPTGSLRATVGVGTFLCRHGFWSMEMQMSTGANATVNHWASMVNCRDGDRCNDQVPGTGMTLAAFVDQSPTDQ
jgi:hypothetical protein